MTLWNVSSTWPYNAQLVEVDPQPVFSRTMQDKTAHESRKSYLFSRNFPLTFKRHRAAVFKRRTAGERAKIADQMGLVEVPAINRKRGPVHRRALFNPV